MILSENCFPLFRIAAACRDDGAPGIDHFTIDKSPRLQAQALNSVLGTVKSGACRPGVGNSVAAEPKEQSATPAAPPSRPGIKG